MSDKNNLKWPLIIAGCGCIVPLIIVAGLAIWFLPKYLRPIPNPPTVKMPKPNAYDYYLAAANSVVEVDQIEFAQRISPQPGHIYSLGQKEALLAKNAKALSTFRQGRLYQYCQPREPDPMVLFPRMARYRDLARLLRLEAQVKSARGEWEGAAKSYLDAIGLGEDIQRGSPVIGMLVGVAAQAIGRRDTWSLASHLNSRQARDSASRIQSMMERRVPWAEVLTEEKWFGQASLQTAMVGPGAPGSSRPFGAFAGLLARFQARESMVYLDRCIVLARQPYSARTRLPLPKDSMARIMAPTIERATVVYTNCEAQNWLLCVTLALRAYRLDNGSYPHSLADLVPRYLKKLPDDPFALKGPLLYKRTGDNYVLYSVGPDGKNDGGKPIDSPYGRPYQNSKGDIVAGINIH